ncbi:MAG: dipeptidase [Pseudomonadota bacterium]|nr:dipeptidase [Pseudomonadota bacterium]
MKSFLSRRSFIAGSTAAAIGLTLYRSALAGEANPYRDAIVIDGLGGLGNSGSDGPLADAYIKDIRDSGVTCLHMTILPVGTTPPDAAFARAVLGVGEIEREIDRHPDALCRVRTVADIVAAKSTGRLGLIYGFQDGVAFETDLSRLEEFHRLGIRIVQPTYNRRNLLGDGCLEPANAGLSKAGVEAIERMNELGILVDLSHCGRQTAADAIRHSKKPVAFTHTGSAALADHPRNRTDAELRAVADQGGVSGIYFMPFLSAGRQPTAADVIRHLEHMVEVCGEDHVSIGTDGGLSAEVVDQAFKDNHIRFVRQRRAAGISAPAETEEGYLFAAELNTPRRLETLAEMLVSKGHSSTRVEKILGKNLLRVLSETWKT